MSCADAKGYVENVAFANAKFLTLQEAMANMKSLWVEYCEREC